MPSLYEPCGLNQIYSLKYGTGPDRSGHGGIETTPSRILIPSPRKEPGSNSGNTILPACWEAIKRALQVYQNRTAWEKLMVRGMAEDFSWEQAAREYVRVYEESLDKKGP